MSATKKLAYHAMNSDAQNAFNSEILKDEVTPLSSLTVVSQGRRPGSGLWLQAELWKLSD